MFKNCVFKVSVDTKKWLKSAGVRAVKTVAQAAIAGIGTAAAMGQVDWKYVVSAFSFDPGRSDQYFNINCWYPGDPSGRNRGFRGRVIALLFVAPAQPAERRNYELHRN